MRGRMRGEGETRREALLRELRDLEAKLTPMRCALRPATCTHLTMAVHQYSAIVLIAAAN